MPTSHDNILRAALFTPTGNGEWGLPMLAWSAPGMAKSAKIEDLAASCDLPCEVLSPGERGEGGFGVVPVPKYGADGRTPETLSYPAPDWTERFKEGRGIVFVDELTTAPPAVQPAMLGLVLRKRIGATVLPPGVRVIAAANPPEQAEIGRAHV